MNSENHYDFLYKSMHLDSFYWSILFISRIVILIGETGGGKTCILSRFTSNTFDPFVKATIGVEFANKSIEIDKHIIRAQIWDTGMCLGCLSLMVAV